MKKSKPEPLTVALVKRLVGAGLTDRQVAVATGHKKNHTKCYRAKYGIPCNPEQREPKVNPRTVRILVAEGWSGPRIADAIGVCQSTLYDAMRREGIETKQRKTKKGDK